MVRCDNALSANVETELWCLEVNLEQLIDWIYSQRSSVKKTSN